MSKSGCAPGTMWEVIKGGVVCVMDCVVHVSKNSWGHKNYNTFYCTSLSGLVPEISHFKDFATIAGYHGNNII